MKFKIAIFSSNDDFVKFIKAIESIANEHCNIFLDLNSFITVANYTYDVVLIDYDTMKEIGVEIVSLESFNRSAIVFVTTQPLLFVSKIKLGGMYSCNLRFVDRQQVSTAMMEIKDELMYKQESIIVKMNKDLYKLYFHEIYEVYSDDHYLIFNLTNSSEPIRSRMWINEIADQLLSNGFVKTKGSAYINIRYIKHIDHKNMIIYFTNGKHTTFSRRHYNELAKRFL